MLWCVLIFFFFKQKTAYEMRISDWSSDVCSSDLPQCRVVQSWDIPCGYDYYSGYYWGCYGTLRVDLVSCSEPVPGATPYTVTSENVVTTTRNESQCSSFLDNGERSEEHTSELQSLMRISYAVFCLKKKKKTNN